MELEKFIKQSLIAIQNGTRQAKTEKTEAANPVSFKDGAQGVEFDISIYIEDKEEKICVAEHSRPGEVATHIKFSVPIVNK